MSDRYFTCKCFLTDNYFVRSIGSHVVFNDRESFLSEYAESLTAMSKDEVDKILEELESESVRRKSLLENSNYRKKLITEKYKPLHPHVYNLQEDFLADEFKTLVEYCRADTATLAGVCHRVTGYNLDNRIFWFPVFTPQFCKDLLAELDHFERSGIPVSRPNTMNRYGVLLGELGFDECFFNPLREKYLCHLSRVMFADWGGAMLDSQRAFTVSYEPHKDQALNLHFDNAEVTINVCLGDDFVQGSLYFGAMRTEVPPQRASNKSFFEYIHEPYMGVMHRAQHLHGALPIEEGRRVNMVVWLRSSTVRNELCPMCDRKPTLVPCNGYGDGFKQEVVDVCALH